MVQLFSGRLAEKFGTKVFKKKSVTLLQGSNLNWMVFCQVPVRRSADFGSGSNAVHSILGQAWRRVYDSGAVSGWTRTSRF